MTMSKLLAVLIILVILASLLSGCIGRGTPSETDAITVEELYSTPQKYHGQTIIVEGFIFLGFETMVLSEKLKESGYAEGHLVPNERVIWFEGGIPTDIYNELYEQNMMGDTAGVGPSERYGKIRVRGKFEYGGQYGHLGGYKYKIAPSEKQPEIQIMSWSSSQ